MIKEIITNEEELSVVSDEVDVRKEGQNVRRIVLDLKDTMRENDVASLSAIQIGDDKREFVINFNGKMKTFVNPMITSVKGFELNRESCPSIPGKEFIVPRYNRIQVIYQTPMGDIKTSELAGVAAMVFQHEVDHLQGILLTDIGLEVDEDYDNASEDDQAEIIKMFLDSLDIRAQQLEEEIAADEDLSTLKKTIDLREKIISGEITFVDGGQKSGTSKTKNKKKRR